MSLLMQALKKAEHAKQKQAGASTEKSAALEEALSLSPKEVAPAGATEAEQAHEPGEFTEPVKAELQMSDFNFSPDAELHGGEPSATPLPNAPPVEPVTGAQDSTQEELHEPEILVRQASVAAALAESDRLAAKNSNRPMSPKREPLQHHDTAQAEKRIASAQQQAKTVFASKQPADKRRTVLIAGAALAACVMLAGAGYVYWQISGPSASGLFPSAPAPQPAPFVPAAAPAPADASAPVNGSSATEPPASAMKSAASPAPAAQETSAASSPEPAHATATTAAPSPARATRASSTPKIETPAATPSPSAQAIQIRHSSGGNQINPSLVGAYHSFISGDAAAARRQYQDVVRKEPNNRDALLGLAAIALNQHQTAQAGALYAKLLELDPADPDAIAGMSGLQHGDPLQSESELKKSLAQNPQSGAVLFALGNLYAQQSRWAEAQQIYFRAFASAPQNPDFAFNLAISLDRLNQARLAQEYYQRALVLAQKNPGNFNPSSVQIRIKELQAAADN